MLGNQGTEVVKVDAGSVNGFTIERDVVDMLNETEIKALINSAFSYDALTNSLTISTV